MRHRAFYSYGKEKKKGETEEEEGEGRGEREAGGGRGEKGERSRRRETRGRGRRRGQKRNIVPTVFSRRFVFSCQAGPFESASAFPFLFAVDSDWCLNARTPLGSRPCFCVFVGYVRKNSLLVVFLVNTMGDVDEYHPCFRSSVDEKSFGKNDGDDVDASHHHRSA